MSLFVARNRLTAGESRAVSYQDVWGSDTEYRRETAPEPALRAIRLAAVFASVRLIGVSFAQIPWHGYRDGSKAPISPAPTILERPSGLVTPSAWRFQLAASLALWGNAYGKVATRDRLGYPTTVEWLAPDSVNVERTGGRKVYTDTLGRPISDVLHVPFQPLPGQVVGMAPLAHAGLVELGREAQEFGRRWFTEGATPSAILYSDTDLAPEESRKLSDRLFNRLRRRRRPVVLGAGLKYEQVSVGANESQFLETVRENRTEIATVFGVPPEMVAGAVGGSSITYASREQRSLDFLTFCLNGYLVAAQDVLSGDCLPRGQVARPATGALLRSDLLTRYQAHELAIRSGIETVDEGRDVEDREPLPDGYVPPILRQNTTTAPATRAGRPEDPEVPQ